MSVLLGPVPVAQSTHRRRNLQKSVEAISRVSAGDSTRPSSTIEQILGAAFDEIVEVNNRALAAGGSLHVDTTNHLGLELCALFKAALGLEGSSEAVETVEVVYKPMLRSMVRKRFQPVNRQLLTYKGI